MIKVNSTYFSEQKNIVKYLDSSFAKIEKLKANAAKNMNVQYIIHSQRNLQRKNNGHPILEFQVHGLMMPYTNP